MKCIKVTKIVQSGIEYDTSELPPVFQYIPIYTINKKTEIVSADNISGGGYTQDTNIALPGFEENGRTTGYGDFWGTERKASTYSVEYNDTNILRYKGLTYGDITLFFTCDMSTGGTTTRIPENYDRFYLENGTAIALAPTTRIGIPLRTLTMTGYNNGKIYYDDNGTAKSINNAELCPYGLTVGLYNEQYGDVREAGFSMLHWTYTSVTNYRASSEDHAYLNGSILDNIPIGNPPKVDGTKYGQTTNEILLFTVDQEDIDEFGTLENYISYNLDTTNSNIRPIFTTLYGVETFEKITISETLIDAYYLSYALAQLDENGKPYWPSTMPAQAMESSMIDTTAFLVAQKHIGSPRWEHMTRDGFYMIKNPAYSFSLPDYAKRILTNTIYDIDLEHDTDITPGGDDDTSEETSNTYKPIVSGDWSTDTTDGEERDISEQTDASDLGFVKSYVLTETRCQELSEVLWSSSFLESIKKTIEEPIDNIISAGISYLPTPSGEDEAMKIGGYDTGVTAYRIQKNKNTVSFGTVKIPNITGSYLDYAPYIKIRLYMPYIGAVDLPTNAVIGATLSLRYYYDYTNGYITACLVAERDDMGKTQTIETYQGNAFESIAITGKNYIEYYRFIAEQVTSLTNSLQNQIGEAGSGIMSSLTGNETDALNSLTRATQSNYDLSQAILNPPTASTQFSGNGGPGLSGAFSPYYPYVLIEYPNVKAYPKNYGKTLGYPSYRGGQVKDFEGFTVFQSVQATYNEQMTTKELNDIVELLKQGVIL